MYLFYSDVSEVLRDILVTKVKNAEFCIHHASGFWSELRFFDVWRKKGDPFQTGSRLVAQRLSSVNDRQLVDRVIS